jgi:glycosyltransferase involved in cell wall biosynthesis
MVVGMKIGYLVSDIDIPLLGHEGCSVHIREFTNALVDAGHDVFILCSALGGGAAITTKARVCHLEPRGLDALATNLLEEEPALQEHHLQWNLKSTLSNLWFERDGASIIEREKPDLIYERYALFGWAGAELSRRYGIPLILEINAPLSIEQETYETFTLRNTAARMEAEVFQSAAMVIVVSQWLKDWVVSRGVDASKVHIVPNAVADRLFRAPVSGEAVRNRYQLAGKRVIGYVGSFQPWHDLGSLLRVFGELHAKDADLRLLLVGDGARREETRGNARRLGLDGAVVFTGAVPHDAIPSLLGAMDVAVAPYGRQQDFYFSPLKLFEYMAAGRAVVAAALGQMGEVVEHARSGWLYPPGDREGLAQGLATLLYTPGLAAALGSAARQKVLHHHTWQATAARIASLVQPVLSPGQGCFSTREKS